MSKMKMELVWHNCKMCPPKESYNVCLYVTDGNSVVRAEWYNNAWHSDNDLLCPYVETEDAEHLWWADLDQTTSGFFNKLKEDDTQC